MHTSNHECRCHLNVTKKCLQHKLSNYLLHVTCYNMWPRPISSLAVAQLQNTHVNLKPASCTHLCTHTHSHNTPSSSYLNLVFISSYYPALTLPTIWPLRTDQEKQLSVLLSLILLAAEQELNKEKENSKFRGKWGNKSTVSCQDDLRKWHKLVNNQESKRKYHHTNGVRWDLGDNPRWQTD